MQSRMTLVFLLVALMMGSSAAFADQQHLVPPSQLATTVADSAAKQDTDRATIRQALERPEVHAVASKLGLDLDHATAAIDTLSGSNLEKAASAAQQVNDQLVGGASNVVISPTAPTTILLLVIILIVALK